jgi:hypothetical protein
MVPPSLPEITVRSVVPAQIFLLETSILTVISPENLAEPYFLELVARKKRSQ